MTNKIGIKGRFNEAIVFTENVESSAMDQIRVLCDQKIFEESKIRVMPDVHAGAGCTIGTTMTIKDVVVPNMVGVDIGCLDCDTEILTKNGWINISNYKEGDILIYDKEKKISFWAVPQRYLISGCDEFYHITDYDKLDMMLSDKHKMLVWEDYEKVDYITEDFVKKHNSLQKGVQGGIKTTFDHQSAKIYFSNSELRLMIMANIIGFSKNTVNTKTYLEDSKKIKRCINILRKAKASFEFEVLQSEYVNITLKKSKQTNKDLSILFQADKDQLKIICDECVSWNNCKKDKHVAYSTTNKIDADVIQFAFAANGIRAEIHECMTLNDKKVQVAVYEIHLAKNEIVRFSPNNIIKQKSKDGKKYCFTVSTGYFIARRNNKIFITGNCGVTCHELDSVDKIDFEKLDKVISINVPSGMNVRKNQHHYMKYINLENLHCYKYIKSSTIDRAKLSMGTLGGGNHFIEIGKDENMENYYLVIHTGSRNIGKEVASFYQRIAKTVYIVCGYDEYRRSPAYEFCETPDRITKMRELLDMAKEHKKHFNLSKELSFLAFDFYEDYIHDMQIMQKYADMNRRSIINSIIYGMDWNIIDGFTTVHNYIDIENNSGAILRKGAVSALKGERIIIPINMRDGSLICQGLGNNDWNMSAPHGAGRLMSRTQAKKDLDLEKFNICMDGIYSSSVCQSTLDESPMAYKPIDEILENIKDTVVVERIIKPVYNFKSS